MIWPKKTTLFSAEKMSQGRKREELTLSTLVLDINLHDLMKYTLVIYTDSAVC